MLDPNNGILFNIQQKLTVFKVNETNMKKLHSEHNSGKGKQHEDRRPVPGSWSAEATLHEPVMGAIHREFVKAHRMKPPSQSPSINNGSERQCVT